MAQIKLNKRANQELNIIKKEINGSGSEAISFLYKKYLFFKSEKQKGNTNTDIY